MECTENTSILIILLYHIDLIKMSMCIKILINIIYLLWHRRKKVEEIFLIYNELMKWTIVKLYTAKGQCRKVEKHIHRKGIARRQSQFPHSCVCERFIYSHDRSAYSAAGKYVDRSWVYINRSQTHECRNWVWGRAIPRKGINKWDFRCSVYAERFSHLWGNVLMFIIYLILSYLIYDCKPNPFPKLIILKTMYSTSTASVFVGS